MCFWCVGGPSVSNPCSLLCQIPFLIFFSVYVFGECMKSLLQLVGISLLKKMFYFAGKLRCFFNSVWLINKLSKTTNDWVTQFNHVLFTLAFTYSCMSGNAFLIFTKFSLSNWNQYFISAHSWMSLCQLVPVCDSKNWGVLP